MDLDKIFNYPASRGAVIHNWGNHIRVQIYPNQHSTTTLSCVDSFDLDIRAYVFHSFRGGFWKNINIGFNYEAIKQHLLQLDFMEQYLPLDCPISYRCVPRDVLMNLIDYLNVFCKNDWGDGE